MNSTPEPDIAWATRGRYVDRHPTPTDTHLLIEVSNSSKVFDRGEKLKLYAAAGIAEYWIVDVIAQTVEVFTEPDSGAFGKSKLHASDGNISPARLPTATLVNCSSIQRSELSYGRLVGEWLCSTNNRLTKFV